MAAPHPLSPVNAEVKNAGSVSRRVQRVLVTGGAGFLGSHLCERLLGLGHEVICVDNFFSGQKSNITHLLDNPRFEFIRHDVTQPLFLEADQVYHLACPASPVFYQKDPIYTIKTGVLGTMNMLGLAKRCGARFLITSTSEVYGDPDMHPQKEEYWGNVNMIGIRSCYDEGKRIAETLAMEYLRQHNVQIRIARLFNTYGPRMLENDGRVVSNFIVQALTGKPFTIYGDGSQTRSFCFVSDTIDALIRLMNQETTYGPVNIGNPGEYTIKQLAETVQSMVDPSVPITYKPIPSDDPRKRQPDITLAKEHLRWQPLVPLQQGLELTIADFRARLAAAAAVDAENQAAQAAMKTDLTASAPANV